MEISGCSRLSIRPQLVVLAETFSARKANPCLMRTEHCSLHNGRNLIKFTQKSNFQYKCINDFCVHKTATIPTKQVKNKMIKYVKCFNFLKLYLFLLMICISFLKKFLLLFNYSCLHFLSIPPPHHSQTHLPPLPPPSLLILSMCPLQQLW